MDNFTVIYKILSVLEKSLDLQEFDPDCIGPVALGITEERWKKYMEMLMDAGYIKGVSIERYINGQMLVNTTDIRITLKGLEYLSENSIMQRMYKAAKGIADLIP